MAGFDDVTKQAKQFWESRDKRQKSFLLAGVAATVLVLTIFVGLMGSPDYKPLYTGLETADAQTITTQLDAQGIPHQTSADGKTISVPADKLDVARMQTASQGAQHSGGVGFELFDKMSWGQTEFDEKVTYERALEGELERSIETLSGVKSARVHLVMPTDSIYEDQQRPAKASVVLKLSGNSLSKDAVLAIARLVSGAVNDLKPEDVSIIDADSERSLGLGHDGQLDGEGLESVLTQHLISTLEPVVGQDKIRASVNIDYDQGSSDESQVKYDPSVSALLSEQKSEEKTSGGAVTGGVPGTASNTPSSKKSKQSKPSNSPAPQDPVQSSTSENAQYGVNRVELHTVVPAGRIQRVSAAILVDDAVVKSVQGGKVTFTPRRRSQEELNQIQQLAEAVIGFDTKRGDTVSVQNMSFDSNAGATDLPPLGWTDRARKTVSDYSSLLRPVSLLVLFLMAYLFVLRPIQKEALRPGLVHVAEQPALASGSKPDQFALSSAEALVDPTHRAGQLKEQAIELIKQKPANTARAVQAWLREESL